MKLAVSMWSYFQAWKRGSLQPDGFILEAKRIGSSGVELLDFFYRDPSDPWNPKLAPDRVESLRDRAQEALNQSGLPCPIFSISQNFAKPSAAEREAELAKIDFGIREAGHFGSKVVRVFAGDVSEGITFEQAREWIVEGLAAASKLADDAGVRLALENHGKLAGRSDQVRGLIADVRTRSGSEALCANPDTGNFLLVDEPSHDAIANVADLAAMVHFKDFRLASEEDTEAPFVSLGGTRYRGAAVGEGVVELASCVASLKGAGFDGWFSIEYEGEEDCMVAVPRCVRNAGRYLA